MTGLSWLRGSEVYSHDQLIPFLLGLVKQNIKVQAQGDKAMDNIVAMDRGKSQEQGHTSKHTLTPPHPTLPPHPLAPMSLTLVPTSSQYLHQI